MSSSTQSVLVVEDEASIASFVSLYLKNAGYEVRTATNGAEALTSVLIGINRAYKVDGAGIRITGIATA